MNNAAFLLIVLIISVPVSLYLWLRTRKPTTFMSSIDEFQREMGALAHDEEFTPKRKPQPLRPIVPSRPAHGFADKIRAAQKQRQAMSGDDSRGRRRRKRR